jgi:uncharacterized protein (DUF2235 family)
MAEESLARKRIVAIASSTLIDSKPGRQKMTATRREDFKKLCESYESVSLKDWWIAVIYAKWC